MRPAYFRASYQTHHDARKAVALNHQRIALSLFDRDWDLSHIVVEADFLELTSRIENHLDEIITRWNIRDVEPLAIEGIAIKI
jgi:hypothetical protein